MTKNWKESLVVIGVALLITSPIIVLMERHSLGNNQFPISGYPNLIDVQITDEPEIKWKEYEISFVQCEECSEEYIKFNGKIVTQSSLIFLHKENGKYIFDCWDKYNYKEPIDVRIWPIGKNYVTICRKADIWVWGFFKWNGKQTQMCPFKGLCHKPFTNGVPCCTFTEPDCPRLANVLLSLMSEKNHYYL